MKRILTTLAVLMFFASSSFAVVKTNWAEQYNNQPGVEHLSDEMTSMSMDDFMNLTPKKYRQMTGERLGFKKSVQLKVAQKMIKRSQKREDISQGLYIVLAIFWLGWLAIGVLEDWDGSEWIIALVLYALFWLPGFIYSLIKMGDYY